MKKMFTQSGLNLVAKLTLLTVIYFSSIFAAMFGQCSISGVGSINGNVNYGDPINWANPNRVMVSDDLYARAKLDSGETTKYLMVADFGFALAPGATILGIDVQVEVKHDLLADAADASIVLMKGGVAASADRAGTGYYDDKDWINTYGSSTDMWGTTWTAADINSAGFGVLFSVTRNSGPTALYVYVDQILVTVYYTGGSCILPIKLKEIEAHRTTEKTVDVNWTTTSEIDNDFFSIERSVDGRNFASIGTLQGEGNSSNQNSYHFQDPNSLSSTAYYRLMQVDQNGEFAYSEIVSVDAWKTGALAMIIYPNPAQDVIHLAAETDNGIVRIFDLGGSVVLEKQLGKINYENSSLDVATLPNGMYILELQDGPLKSAQKLVLQ